MLEDLETEGYRSRSMGEGSISALVWEEISLSMISRYTKIFKEVVVSLIRGARQHFQSSHKSVSNLGLRSEQLMRDKHNAAMATTSLSASHCSN